MLREFIVKDFGWKLLSLALAVAIWLTVKSLSRDSGSQAEDEHTFDLPAQIVSSNTDVRRFRMNPDAVKVTVKARPEIIKKLTEQDLHAFVDVSTGELTRSVRQRVDVSTPTRITLVKVEPAEVEVVVPPRTITPNPSAKP